MRALKLMGKILLGIVVVVIALAATLYFFGGMERPSKTDYVRYQAMVDQGLARPVPSKFTIPIPGCKCHSKDPLQIVGHASYRIRDCKGCHDRK